MFEFIRTHQRWIMMFLMLLIIPSFGLLGIGNLDSFGSSANTVAKVAGRSITKQEFDNALRDQVNRYRQVAGDKFDPKLFDTPEEKQKILDGMITERVLDVAVDKQHLSVSDQVIRESVSGIAGLIGPDGKFDSERYKSLLAAQGLTPLSYEARLRQDLAKQQLNVAIQSSGFVPKSVASRLSDIAAQEREVQEFLLKSADYVADAKVSDQMIKDYYAKNGKKFEVPAQLKAEYAVLNADVVAAQVSVSDADIAAFYESNKDKRFTAEEQRRASHILINLKKGAPAAEQAIAKAKAQALLDQVRKEPASFAKVAKENSQDPGSAERGGDLEFFGVGAMTKEFEGAAYKLNKGEISDLVQTEFGYHIIMLTDLKPATVRPLDEVKGDITAELKKPLISKKYAEMAEIFNNTVDDQSDSLKPAADKLKLQVETVSGLTSEPNLALGATSPFNNVKFLKAIFADEAIKSKRNTQAVEVAPSVLVAGRVLEFKPATVRPLDEVKTAIHDYLIQIEAGKLAKAAGEAKLAAVKASGDVTGFTEARVVSRSKSQGLTNAALPLVMKADLSKLPAYVGVDTLGRGYTIYRINKVVSTIVADPARRQSEQEQISNILAQQDMLVYLDVLKRKSKVVILKPIVVPAVADGESAEDTDGN
jgi:peptidyl-prolyl cis-trans isomerase D